MYFSNLPSSLESLMTATFSDDGLSHATAILDLSTLKIFLGEVLIRGLPEDFIAWEKNLNEVSVGVQVVTFFRSVESTNNDASFLLVGAVYSDGVQCRCNEWLEQIA